MSFLWIRSNKVSYVLPIKVLDHSSMRYKQRALKNFSYAPYTQNLLVCNGTTTETSKDDIAILAVNSGQIEPTAYISSVLWKNRKSTWNKI